MAFGRVVDFVLRYSFVLCVLVGHAGIESRVLIGINDCSIGRGLHVRLVKNRGVQHYRRASSIPPPSQH